LEPGFTEITKNGTGESTFDVTDLPLGGPGRSFTFGFLNNTTGTIDIGDLSVDILNEANFSGANTLMTGFPFLSGGPATISDNATITPGGGTTDLNYNFDELIMNTGATFAPHIDSEIGFFGFRPLFDSLTAEDITLDNANLTPTGGFIAQLAGEIIIVRNEGANPISPSLLILTTWCRC